jgi:hypothetical protein
METTELDRDEVLAFASKLDAFGQQLSIKEQALLHTILRRASAARQDDVEGYDFHSFINQESGSQYVNPYAGAGASGVTSGTEPPKYTPPSYTISFVELIPSALGYVGTYDLYSPQG